MRLRSSGLLVLLTAALTAWVPSARGASSDGEALYTSGLNCTSIIFGNPYTEQETFSFASQDIPDDDTLASGDGPLWVSVSFGSIGDICGGGGHALPEFVPPAGVSVIDDPSSPAYWTLYEDGQTQRGSDPVALHPGRFGGVVAGALGDDGQSHPWPYANSGGFITVHIPLRTTRALNGIGSRRPACVAIQGGYGTCPPEESGDYLQVYNQIADGGTPQQLIPLLGLFATAPTATGGGGGATGAGPGTTPPGTVPPGGGGPGPGGGSRPVLRLTVPSAVRARSAVRPGIGVRLSGLSARASVTVKLGDAHGHRLARVRARASATGALSLRVRLSATAARRLRATHARLRLSVTVGGRTTVRSIRLT